MAHRGTVSPEQLREALAEITSNPEIRRSTAKMRREIEESGGLNRAADRIESLLET
ncbi:hypothetical protein [Saccharopolyspora sp. NPDC049357]|uniref:hypothetical protein n=1 Tax=Saccharopolyspora sp. NPDC049357 TaxID=3154507 RepID=UPI0034486E74